MYKSFFFYSRQKKQQEEVNLSANINFLYQTEAVGGRK
jgi:hypothetical protein